MVRNLRHKEYHPDKRPDSPTETGRRVTQELNSAWETLRDPGKREAHE